MCLLIAAGCMRRCAWGAVDLQPEPEGKSMRVAVIGAGAMGSLVSILLHESGAEVVVYEKREERVAWLRENVHGLGASVGSQELIRRATGRALSASPWLRYAEYKYLEDATRS